ARSARGAVPVLRGGRRARCGAARGLERGAALQGSLEGRLSAMFGAPTSKAMVRPMRLVVLAFVVALVGLLAVGCGGGQGTTVAMRVLHELGPVADATEDADSASFDLGFEFRMGGLDMPLGFTASGAYDTPAKRAELTMDLGSFAKMMSGFAGALGGDAPKEL